jgi:glycosyltransferase 2 family protein
MLQRLRTIAGPALAIVLFSAALYVLYGEVRRVTWEQFVSSIEGIPPVNLALAAGIVALNYAVLCSYDLLALRYLQRHVPFKDAVRTAFVGYALGNNLGSVIAGGSVRWRLYTSSGLTRSEIGLLLLFLGLTFWVGAGAIGGAMLVSVPLPLPSSLNLPFGTRTIGVLLMLIPLIYLIACAIPKRNKSPDRPAKTFKPTFGMGVLQIVLAALDLTLTATALYLVLPQDVPVPYAQVLAAFLLAMTVSLLCQVPGGLGVLEVILLKLLDLPGASTLLGPLLIFRVLYHWLPLVPALILLVAHELRRPKAVALATVP